MITVRVAANDSHFGQDVTIRQFGLVVDEPPTLGGDDAGPTPLEYLLASLGSCKAITLQMYADRKGWQLGKITIDLTYEARPGEEPVITANLFIEGDLTDEQRERLREISDRCPVHKLLTHPLQIQTQLAD